GLFQNLELTLKHLVHELGLRKICSAAIAYNKRSLAYSKKCGYVVEGVLKEHILKGGTYWDEVLLAAFRKGWKKAWNIYRDK
ncbi:MAG: hypothetical protein B7Z09_06930, partial [Brevundimonas diminuta]